MTRYQPIESAPRDREICIAVIHGDEVSELRATWQDRICHPDVMFPVQPEGWRSADGSVMNYATHWRA